MVEVGLWDTRRMEKISTHSVSVERIAQQHYRACNPTGASVEFGQGKGLLTPVELLLAAVAGCTAVDVDVVTSRRAEPEVFEIGAEAEKISEEGATRLQGVDLSFRLEFPDSEEGRQAEALIDCVLQLSHDKDCTVSRTIEAEIPVRFKRV